MRQILIHTIAILTTINEMGENERNIVIHELSRQGLLHNI